MSSPHLLELANHIIWFDDGDNEELPPELTPEEQAFWIIFADFVGEWLDENTINHLANALHLDSFRLTVSNKLSSTRTLTNEANSIFDFKKTINSILPKKEQELASRSNSIIRLNTGSSVGSGPKSAAGIIAPILEGSTPPPKRRRSSVTSRRRSSVSSMLSDGTPGGVVHVQHLPNFFSDVCSRFFLRPAMSGNGDGGIGVLSDRDMFEYVYTFWRSKPVNLRPKRGNFAMRRTDVKDFLPVLDDDVDMMSYKTHSDRKPVTYFSPKTGKKSLRMCTEQSFEYECEIFRNVNNFSRLVDWVMDFWRHFDESSTPGALLGDAEIEEILSNTRGSSRRDLVRMVQSRKPRNVLQDGLERLVLPGVHPKRFCVVGHGVYTTEKVSNLNELRVNNPEKYQKLVEGGVVDPNIQLDETEEQTFCFLETRVWDVLDLWMFGLWTDDVWFVRLSSSFDRVFQ